MKKPKRIGYWSWLLVGTGAAPGWRRFLDRWLLFHIAIGALTAFGVPVTLAEAAKSVLLPLVGVLVGLTFAWAGNAQALLQTKEIQKLSDYHPGGFEEYVYVYLTAILTVLITVVLWGLAGLEVFELPCIALCTPYSYGFAKFFLFFISSVALRECWHVVLFAQVMLLARKDLSEKSEENAKSP